MNANLHNKFPQIFLSRESFDAFFFCIPTEERARILARVESFGAGYRPETWVFIQRGEDGAQMSPGDEKMPLECRPETRSWRLNVNQQREDGDSMSPRDKKMAIICSQRREDKARMSPRDEKSAIGYRPETRRWCPKFVQGEVGTRILPRDKKMAFQYRPETSRWGLDVATKREYT